MANVFIPKKVVLNWYRYDVGFSIELISSSFKALKSKLPNLWSTIEQSRLMTDIKDWTLTLGTWRSSLKSIFQAFNDAQLY